MSIEIQGLDALLRRVTDTTAVEIEAKRAEREGLIVLRDEARHGAMAIASDGRLPNSVRYEVMSGGLSGIVGSVAKTALSIAQGRKHGEMPSTKLLGNWLDRRNATYDIRTHRRVTHKGRGRLAAQYRAIERRAERDLAWKIALAIRDRGTKPLPFIIPAARNKEGAIQIIFRDAVQRAMEKLAHGR